jgi:uncharacterized protein (TIGR01777 family)
MYKRAIIAGGTGFMGQALIETLKDHFRTIVVLTRGKTRKEGKVKFMHWDAKKVGGWSREVDGADLLVNLCGRSVDCRYNEDNKQAIIDSRVESTLALGAAAIMAINPPKVWINAGSATIYEHAEQQLMTEDDGLIGHGFSVDVCKKWEGTFNEIPVPGTRKVLFRFALILGRKGGVLQRLLQIGRFGLAGTCGKGNQKVSWVHEDDFLNMMLFAINNEKIEGTYNCTAPHPVRNGYFMRAIRETAHFPLAIPLKKWMLNLGARLIGTETELLLKSRNVFPKKMLEAGFKFRFPYVMPALKDLV